MKTETLVRALDRFSEFTYDDIVLMGIIEYEDHKPIHFDFHTACRLAAEWLSQRDIDGMKFRYLKAEMKRLGMEDLYQCIMNESLDGN